MNLDLKKESERWPTLQKRKEKNLLLLLLVLVMQFLKNPKNRLQQQLLSI
jgi:hypothetical protein